MQHTNLGLILITVGASIANAQAVPTAMGPESRLDLSLGYNHIRANAPPGSCNCFGGNGGYLSAGLRVAPWLSVAGEFTGGHAEHISSLGQDLTLTTLAVGPRVSFVRNRFTIFAQVLFGGARGSDSYFPGGTAGTPSASSRALSTGGGINLNVNHRFAIRAVEAQYLRTDFPNGSNNQQNHLLIGSGLVVKFGGLHKASAKRTALPYHPVEPARETVQQVAPAPQEAAPAPQEAAPAPPTAMDTSGQNALFHENVHDALFDYDSDSIRPDAQIVIDRAALFLKDYPEITVVVGGYADERGSAEYNLILGENRAKAARSALISAGVGADRIQVVSYGKEVQVCTSENETCRQQNRRAVFSMQR